MASDPFDNLLSAMADSEIATQADLKGCNAKQIAKLEANYGFPLPTTYRRYLKLMGNDSGRLFAHDHVDTDYDYVMDATTELRDQLTDFDFGYRLPNDALVILGRNGEQYNLIRCRGTEDSSVWALNLGDVDTSARLFKRSVLGWLRAWMHEASEAIASGYYSGGNSR